MDANAALWARIQGLVGQTLQGRRGRRDTTRGPAFTVAVVAPLGVVLIENAGEIRIPRLHVERAYDAWRRGEPVTAFRLPATAGIPRATAYYVATIVRALATGR